MGMQCSAYRSERIWPLGVDQPSPVVVRPDAQQVELSRSTDLDWHDPDKLRGSSTDTANVEAAEADDRQTAARVGPAPGNRRVGPSGIKVRQGLAAFGKNRQVGVE